MLAFGVKPGADRVSFVVADCAAQLHLRDGAYIPSNLTPSTEIVRIAVQKSEASDLFQLPN